MVCRTVPQPVDDWKSTSSNNNTSDILSSMIFRRCDCYHQAQGKCRAVHDELVHQTRITDRGRSSLLVLTFPFMLSRGKPFTTLHPATENLRHSVTTSN